MSTIRNRIDENLRESGNWQTADDIIDKLREGVAEAKEYGSQRVDIKPPSGYETTFRLSDVEAFLSEINA